jgi:TolA-binding protein
VSRGRVRGWAGLALLVTFVAASASCAYYNTFYLARRYYLRATNGLPYEVDREGSTQRSNYTKSADYSKKVLGIHPKSKWVDDAWLMWARTFVGTDDPLKAVAMLQEFETRFPNSDLRPDAEFFLGLAFRAARRHEAAVDRFDNFLAQAPRHELVPYAWYERSRALLSLQRYREAGESAGEILKRFPRHVLVDRALRQRAEARFQQRDWKGARVDFASIGARALTDDDRLRHLLREVDCLEADRSFDEARALLRDARAHVPQPPPQPAAVRTGPTAAAPGSSPPQPVRPASNVPGADRYGRITLRMGSVELLAGRVNDAIRLYESVIQDYPRSQLASEAQFRIGYAWETGADDFPRARAEYQKVKEQAGTSQFSQQAQQRTDNLDRIERFRTASGADSAARKAESRFLTAEHYLFNLDRPERALEEYRAIADSSTDSTVIARALNAQAWVMSRRLDRRADADSLFWSVVRGYPRTEAQLAARDYLEGSGQVVPAGLIVAPEVTQRPFLEPEPTLTPPPGSTPRLGAGRLRAEPDPRTGAAPPPPGEPGEPRAPLEPREPGPPDSLRRVLAMRDSITSHFRQDTTAIGRARLDSLRRSFFAADTAGRAAQLAAIQRSAPRPESARVVPGGDRPLLEARRADSLRWAIADSVAAAARLRSVVARVDTSDAPPGAGPDTTRRVAPRPAPGTGGGGAPAAPPAAAAAPAPEATNFRSITSFERKPRDPQARERARAERLRARAVKDSLERARKAARQAEKQKRKSPPPVAAPTPPAAPPAGAARADSAARPAPADTTARKQP